MKKQQLRIYEIVNRTPYGDTIILGTTDIKTAARTYRKMIGNAFRDYRTDQLPRLKIDGKDIPICEADKLMRGVK